MKGEHYNNNEIQRILRECSENLYFEMMESLEEMSKLYLYSTIYKN